MGRSPFRLQQDPFSEETGRETFFTTPGLAALLRDLREALTMGHVLLLDHAGSGKSTLLRRLVTDAHEHWRHFQGSADQVRGARGLVHEMLRAFGLPRGEPAMASVRDMEIFLERQTSRGHLVVLSLDDAHHLDAEAGAQLLCLLDRWEGLSVRVLLCGEPGLGPRLRRLGAASGSLRAAPTFSVPRLSPDEARDYLHMRLFHAGLEGDSPFDAEVAARLAAESRGEPAALNRLAREIVERALQRSGHPALEAWRETLSRHWPVVAILCGGIALASLSGQWRFFQDASHRGTPVSVSAFQSRVVVGPSGADDGYEGAPFRASSMAGRAASPARRPRSMSSSAR